MDEFLKRKTDKIREKIRESLINGASRHKLVARIVERCENLPDTADKRAAAIAQTGHILQIPSWDARALVSEMMV